MIADFIENFLCCVLALCVSPLSLLAATGAVSAGTLLAAFAGAGLLFSAHCARSGNL